MDYKALADILFPHVTQTPEEVEARYPARDLPEGAKVTRMAPSPTGFMHLGNLYGAITDERLAHQSGGVFYLRIEDTDQKREVEGGVEKILEVFSEYGLPFDEGATLDGDNGAYGPYRQRQRAGMYQVFGKWLVEQGKAYPCFCSEEELAAIREKQAAAKENFGYYGKYALHRDLSMEEIEAKLAQSGGVFVLRFRSEGDTERRVKFTDLVKGNMEFPENDQDIVLLKSDGIPTYHFAHVVDDHLMRTTHVVRGEEWLPTLPVHVQLFQAMGWRLPKYIHTAQLMKMDGGSKRKLSKRKDPELALDYYREQGYTVACLKEYLMTLLNSNFEEWRIANPAAPLDAFPFNVKKMGVSGSLFDLDKLIDISKNVVSRLTAEEAYDLLAAWAQRYDTEFAALLTRDPAYSKAILAIGRGGKKPRKDIAVWGEAKAYMDFFFDELFQPEYAWPENATGAAAKQILEAYAGDFALPEDSGAWFDGVKALAASLGYAADMKLYKQNPTEYPGNVGDVSMVLRVAVTGRQNSPDLFEVMKLLGADRVKARFNRAIASL
ncbi:glutamate--tRNA ligase [Ruminococcaceae bacterium OttesenSCG-928-L11]|nr:glutamate--tRNA ligase [Ruminococcaceae bacterium OttesenSCG-928-L11]